jgi:hypothetical protein
MSVREVETVVSEGISDGAARQTVNSYHDGESDFAALLRASVACGIRRVDSPARIRMTFRTAW